MDKLDLVLVVASFVGVSLLLLGNWLFVPVFGVVAAVSVLRKKGS
jgi:hypothetical protein